MTNGNRSEPTPATVARWIEYLEQLYMEQVSAEAATAASKGSDPGDAAN